MFPSTLLNQGLVEDQLNLTYPQISPQLFNSSSFVGDDALFLMSLNMHPRERVVATCFDGGQDQFGASSNSCQNSTRSMWLTGEEAGDNNKSKGKGKGKDKAKTSYNKNSVDVINMKKLKGRRKVREPRFCFKTLSEVDVLDDGYKWRKYGQKAVKNTHHSRSYYRCTQDNCRVKKRVERLAEDPRMVITTYEGRHVHGCPPSSNDDCDTLGFISY